jgi:hypothetical protein
LHAEYVRLASLSKEERNAEISEIRKDADKQIKDAEKRQELISSGRTEDLDEPSLAFATPMELEVTGMLKALELRYPEYSVKNLGNILKNLIDDLGAGKVSDKEFAKLIGEAVSDFTKDKKDPDLRALAKTLVDSTGFFKRNMVG